MELIAFTGRKGSGKDLACSHVQKWAADRDQTAARRGFADQLKLVAARVFFPDTQLPEAIAWCDRIKNENRFVITAGQDYHGPDHVITGREFLQRLGTEGGRDVYGDDHWVDVLLPIEAWIANFRVDSGSNLSRIGDPFVHSDTAVYADYGVIIDLRFENEAERVNALGGRVIEIVRPTLEDDGDNHASEQRLPNNLVTETVINRWPDEPSGAFKSRIQNLMTRKFVHD